MLKIHKMCLRKGIFIVMFNNSFSPYIPILYSGKPQNVHFSKKRSALLIFVILNTPHSFIFLLIPLI